MDISKVARVTAVMIAFGAGTHALGQTTTPPTTAPRPTSVTLTIPELVERLTREGYSDFGEVERKSDKLYKVEARDTQRRTQEMYVDARTAEILSSEEDEDK